MNPSIVDVLVVDDSSTSAELLLYALNELDAALRCLWLEDGHTALEWLLRRGAFADRTAGLPRLVFLDLEMPGITGLQVLEYVQQDPATSVLPVVIWSARDDPRTIEKCYALGASSYAVKPVQFEHYVATVQHIARYWLSGNPSPPRDSSWPIRC